MNPYLGFALIDIIYGLAAIAWVTRTYSRYLSFGEDFVLLLALAVYTVIGVFGLTPAILAFCLFMQNSDGRVPTHNLDVYWAFGAMLLNMVAMFAFWYTLMTVFCRLRDLSPPFLWDLNMDRFPHPSSGRRVK